MLKEIYIKNFALIDEMKISFTRGLNILSGETGAGKSIIVEAIKLVLGNRAANEYIRSGAEIALIEAIFEINSKNQKESLNEFFENYGLSIDEENSLFLCRELSFTGKNICRLNGRMIPLSVFKEVGQYLIELHGQGQQQLLSKSSFHLELLDNMGGKKTYDLKQRIKELYKQREKYQKELEKFYFNAEDKERQLDLLKYQYEEINKANLSQEEEEVLREEKNKINHIEKLTSNLNFIHDELYRGSNSSSIVDRLGVIQKELELLVSIDDSLSSNLPVIEQAITTLTESAFELSRYLDELSFEPERLDEIHSRLELINSLKRKYGADIKEILSYGEKLQNEIQQLLESEKKIEKLQKQIDDLEKELNLQSQELSEIRKKEAVILEKNISDILKELEMPESHFSVDFKTKDNYTANGIDEVEYLFSANPGEPLKPLSKIASGGEMSRIMLALRSVLAQADEIPTIIFDEVDVGIGGTALQAVGEKLFLVALHRQVICVTHSPQIASMADSHYAISKNVKEGRTYTGVKKLSEEERKMEIARMVSGSKTTELTMKHAEEMIQKAGDYKQKS